VEEQDLPEDGDIATAAVAAAVLPGGRRLVQDDVLSLPAKRLVKTRTEQIDGQVRCCQCGICWSTTLVDVVCCCGELRCMLAVPCRCSFAVEFQP
jgi:hypothetical protein